MEGNDSTTDTTNQMFPLSYVKELRTEAADNRIKAKEFETQKLTLENELKALKDELLKAKNIVDEYGVIKEQNNKLLEERKSELLSKIPEGKRDSFKDFNLDALKVVVSNLIDVTSQSPGTLPLPEQGKEKEFSEMTEPELLKFMQENPSGYAKALQESINKQLSKGY